MLRREVMDEEDEYWKCVECGMQDEECDCVDGFQPYEEEEIIAMRNAEGDFNYSESEDSVDSNHGIEREKPAEEKVGNSVDIMSRVNLERYSEEKLKQIAEEREMYTRMYKKVIADSWIGV